MTQKNKKKNKTEVISFHKPCSENILWLELDLEMIQTIVVQMVIYDLLQLMDKRRWDTPYIKPQSGTIVPKSPARSCGDGEGFGAQAPTPLRWKARSHQ